MKTVIQHLILVLSSAVLFALPVSGASADPGALDLARRLNNVFIEVAETVSPSVVVIRVACKPGSHATDPDEAAEILPRKLRRGSEPALPVPPVAPRKGKPTNAEPVFDGQGSGVVIREDGYILTNFHVVEDAQRIKVRFKNGRVHDATVRGVDPQSDLAVLKINEKGLPAARFGNSDTVRVGEFAIAIGAPFELENSVTFGHVSAKGRSDVICAEEDCPPGATMD